MNPLNLFKFLEKEKGKPIPLEIKLEYGLPLTPEDINVGGSLDLENTSITSLPENLQIGATLFLKNTLITSLPKNLKIGGHLDIQETKISFLPPDLEVGKNIYIFDTPLKKKFSDKKIQAMLTTGYIKGEIKRNEYS